MKTKFLSVILLVLFFVVGSGLNQAQAQSVTPTPSPTPAACESTTDGAPGPWVYAIGGASRSRTIPLVDAFTGGDCGSKVETEYPYCSYDGDVGYTGWAAAEQAPKNSTPGQCGGGYSTITICFQGKTIEVLNNGEELSSYRGYTEGACPTPTQPPPNNGGPGDGLSDGKSDGRSSCPDCTKPQNSGSVLGASTDTLAATGSQDQLARMVIGATAAFIVFLLGHSLARNNETY